MFGQNHFFGPQTADWDAAVDFGAYDDFSESGSAAPESPLLAIRYGLRSPTFAHRVAAVRNFAALFPEALVEGNAFVAALNAAEPREDAFFVRTTKDAVEFLTNVLIAGDVWLVENAEKMTSIGYFFKALGRAVETQSGLQMEQALTGALEEHNQELRRALTADQDLKVELRGRIAELEGEVAQFRSKPQVESDLKERFKMEQQINSYLERQNNFLHAQQVEERQAKIAADKRTKELEEQLCVATKKLLAALENHQDSAEKLSDLSEQFAELETEFSCLEELYNIASEKWERLAVKQELSVQELSAKDESVRQLQDLLYQTRWRASVAEEKLEEMEKKKPAAVETSEAMIPQPKSLSEALDVLNAFVNQQWAFLGVV